jgi:hypothetical protein
MVSALVIFTLAVNLAFINRIIGDGDERTKFPNLLQSRVAFILIWVGLVALSSGVESSFSIEYMAICTLVFGTGYWWFRQIVGPDIAFQAGHGGIGVSPVTKQWDTNRSNGLWQGALIGLVKSSYVAIIGLLALSPWCLLFLLLGLGYGYIHRYTHDFLKPAKRMRENAEYIIGGIFGTLSGILIVAGA